MRSGIVVTAVLCLVGASASGELEKAAEETHIIPCVPATPRIEVNAATGHVVYPAESLITPGDLVCVTLFPANVADYRYTLHVRDERIVNFFPVVGASDDPLFDKASRDVPPTPTLRPTPMPYADFPRELEALGHGVDALRYQTETSWNAVMKERASLPSALKTSCPSLRDCHWPTSSWPTGTRADLETQATHQALEKVQRQLQSLQRTVALDAPTLLLGQNALGWTAENLKEAKAVVDTVRAEVLTQAGNVGVLRDTLRRWSLASERFPRPIIEMGYRVKRGNRRYVATISGEATVVPEASGLVVTSAPLPDNTWALAFEGHERSSFVLGLGLAGIYKGNPTFGITSSLDADGKVIYNARQTRASEFEPKFIATLGMYLGSVDTADLNRPDKWFVFVGTDVSKSPELFLFGLGRDFARGLQVSAVFTRYDKRSLPPGWALDQLVKTKEDGAPLIAAVPTTTRGRLGFGLAITFRPAIFKTFKDILG